MTRPLAPFSISGVSFALPLSLKRTISASCLANLSGCYASKMLMKPVAGGRPLSINLE